jgi:hypothetical protein
LELLRRQHAHLRGWLPCVDGLDTIASDDAATRGAVRELLRDHHGPLAVRLPRHVTTPLEPGYVMIELPTSTIAERAAQWSEILGGTGMAVPDLDELAARFTVGPGTIRNVVASVARSAPPDPDPAIETALRQYLESKLGTVATRVTRLATWSQIVLPADIQDSIVELVARIRHRRTVYDTWGFDQVMATSRGLTALFQGSPGTGKTLVASAIANELGLDLYRIDLSRVMSKWIGETEQNLAKVFDAAEEGQALILFDEADSLFGKRTEVRTSVDRYANLETNYLLQRLDTFEGVAVLTTNFGTAIDAAFKRRLSCRLTFPFPDDEARERIQMAIEQAKSESRLAYAGDVTSLAEEGCYVAPHVFAEDLFVERSCGSPIEARGVVAVFDRRQRTLKVWDATQAPLTIKNGLANMLGLPEFSVDVIAPDVGGGFGTKIMMFFAEEVPVPWAAMQLDRPVKWTEDRHRALHFGQPERARRIPCAWPSTTPGTSCIDDRARARHRAYTPYGMVVPIITVTQLPGSVQGPELRA